jgi:tRNA wybutosine-synthesizing protein 4
MLAHFRKLQASIYAIERYLTLEQQSSRFLESGWKRLDIAHNLWDLWSDDVFTPPSLRRHLDTIEPFDEWEEFALFGGHYFLLVASNAELTKSTETPGMIAESVPSCTHPNNVETINIFHHEGSAGSSLTPRRFTAAFKLGEDTVAVHGGQGQSSRLSSVEALRRMDQPLEGEPYDMQGPSARMCHTVTSMSDHEALLVGGRGSPTQAFNDCWLVRDGAWTKVDDISTARYRHSAVSVPSQGDTSRMNGVLIFGGKASDGTVLGDWTLWSDGNGWHSIPVNGPRPSARFGAAMSSMGTGVSWGLLLGGMCQSGTVLEDVWEWTMTTTPTPQICFKDRTNDIRSPGMESTYARVGASLVPWDGSMLLIGGVSRKGIHSLSEDFLLLLHSSTEINIRQPVMQLPTTQPLLVGMGVVAVSRSEVVIAGGGAVCFSMGSFWNEGYLTVTKAGMQGLKEWRKMMPRQVDGTAAQAKPPGATRKGQFSKGKKIAVRTVTVPRIRLQSAEDFSKLVAASKPAIIEGIDVGPCTDLWTLDYLKERIGADRELVVHECTTDRMTFKDKNFQYVKRSTAEFLDGIADGSKAYLRAVSCSQPNKLPTRLSDDFPSIAADFKIPELFRVVEANLHSSPLRIAGPVSLWLHYDVLANILCQIRGSKTLRLYPPSDVKYLNYPPGGSSSNTDVLTSSDPELRFTHPHVARLVPGDVLFIPPMWSHTATPEDGVSVAVNVFWRDLEKGYAAGKDVYGNRDLQAYENGRRDVEKILKAFRDLPRDVAGFYLERLAGEIGEKVGKVGTTKEGDGEREGK